MDIRFTDFSKLPQPTVGSRRPLQALDATELQKQINTYRAALDINVTPAPLAEIVDGLDGERDVSKKWSLREGAIQHTQRKFQRIVANVVQLRKPHEATRVCYPHVMLAEAGGFTYLALHRSSGQVLVELRPEPGNPASKNFTLFGATAQASRGRVEAEQGMATLLGVLVGLPTKSQSRAVGDGARFRGEDGEGRVDTICVVEVDDREALERQIPDNLTLVWTTPDALLKDPNFDDCGHYLKLALQQLSRWEMGQA